MTQFYQYRNALLAADSWVEPFTLNVRLGGISLTTLAEHLQVGTSSIILDDPDADLGHAGETMLGLHRFELIESDATAGDNHIVIAFIGETRFRRGDTERPSLRTGAQRQIELSLLDLNSIASFVVIDPDDPDAKRPAETVDDRLAWLLASDYLLGRVHDDGVVESSSVMMDAAEYGGQTAANVIGDCELAAGFGWNAWIYYLEDAGHYSLGFINANTSTLYSSDLRISNDLDDIDTDVDTGGDFETGTTFAPLYEAELTRDYANVVSGVHVPYRNSHVFRERQATKDIYGPREQSAPNSNLRTRARARAMADDFLFQHRTPAENIHVAIEVPTSKANAIKAGHRLQVKFTHLPGYEGFTWCRVIRRTIIQEQATDRYIIDMDLSPQEPGCSGDPSVVQWAYDDSLGVGTDPDTARFSLDAASTSGNLLVLAFMEDPAFIDDATMPAGWSSAIFNEEMLGTTNHCSVIYKVSAGEQSVDIVFDDTATGTPRYAFLEINGLTNATLHAAATIKKESPGAGAAIVPATSYPDGPMALLTFCFMHGPEDPDVLTVEGTGHTLQIPWDVAWDATLINPGIGVGGLLHDTSGTSGTTPLYPAAGGWRFLFTNNHPTMTVGLVFTGDNCT